MELHRDLMKVYFEGTNRTTRPGKLVFSLSDGNGRPFYSSPQGMMGQRKGH
jgi:hypothetical protein